MYSTYGAHILPSILCVRAYVPFACWSLVFSPPNIGSRFVVERSLLAGSHGNAAIVARPLHGQLCGVACTLESNSSKMP